MERHWGRFCLLLFYRLVFACSILSLAVSAAQARVTLAVSAAQARTRRSKAKRAKSEQTEASRLDTPTQDGSPTLRQTSDWLAETFADYGRQDWDTSPSAIQNLAIDGECNLSWEDVTNPGKNASYTQYSVPLGAVTRITINPQSVGGSKWFDLDLHTDKAPVIANSSWVGKRKLFSNGNPTDEVWFAMGPPQSNTPLTYEQVTPLIQKALQHAVELCRGTWQPPLAPVPTAAQKEYSQTNQWFQSHATSDPANRRASPGIDQSQKRGTAEQEASAQQANQAAQEQQDIHDKIDTLNQDIQQQRSDAEDADQKANELASNSDCNGGFGAYAQIARQGCENINAIGVAKFRSQAAKDRNRIDDDRAEIARLQREQVQEAPHRDASFAGALAQTMQQNPQPSIVETANQQAANMIAVGAADDAARRQAAEQRRAQVAAQQMQANAQRLAQEVANGTLTEQQAMQQIQQQAQQAAQQQSASGGPQSQAASPCAGFPAFITASSSAFSPKQLAGGTDYFGSLTFNIPPGYHGDGAEIDYMAQGTSFAAGSGTVITIGDTASGPAKPTAIFILANATNQMTYRASFATNVPAPFSITLKRDDQHGCGQGSATGGAGVPQ